MDIAAEIDGTGFCYLHGVSVVDLEAIARGLGPIRVDPRAREQFRAISPSNAADARPNTLSSRYGWGSFPFHTDTAHWRVPARYLLLYCQFAGAGGRSTYLIDSREWKFSLGDRRMILNEVFRVGYRRPFLSTVACAIKQGLEVRWDPASMSPVSRGAKTVQANIAALLAGGRRTKIAWHVEDLLIVDNRRILHARGDADQLDADRVLIRALVGG